MNDSPDFNYDKDNFDDIIARDNRYNARAYTILMDVLEFLGADGNHFSGQDIIEEFRDFALDEFGPLAYTVLTEWGLHSTEDIGEMMFNLVEGKRICRDENDFQSAFVGGYDFKEAFLGPYRP